MFTVLFYTTTIFKIRLLTLQNINLDTKIIILLQLKWKL